MNVLSVVPVLAVSLAYCLEPRAFSDNEARHRQETKKSPISPCAFVEMKADGQLAAKGTGFFCRFSLFKFFW